MEMEMGRMMMMRMRRRRERGVEETCTMLALFISLQVFPYRTSEQQYTNLSYFLLPSSLSSSLSVFEQERLFISLFYTFKVKIFNLVLKSPCADKTSEQTASSSSSTFIHDGLQPAPVFAKFDGADMFQSLRRLQIFVDSTSVEIGSHLRNLILQLL